MAAKRLVIVAHTPSDNTQALADALQRGAERESAGLQIEVRAPLATTARHIDAADGLILFTTENFGYMSGAMKDLFDRSYYDLIDSKRGLPYALVIRAGKDGTGTKRACESIIKGLGWKAVQEALILRGEFKPEFLSQAEELGQAFALGLSEGIF